MTNGPKKSAKTSWTPDDAFLPPATLARVFDVLMFRCAAPPWMIIGAVGFTVPLALWSIFSPNWKDTVRMGSEGSWIHNLRLTMEGAEAETPAWFGTATEFAFEFLEVNDEVLFWIMVGEVIGESLIQATSMIWEFSPCNRHGPTQFYHSNTPVGLILNDTLWKPDVSFINGVSNFWGSEHGPEIYIPAHASANYAVAIQCGEFAAPSVPVAVNVRFREGDTAIKTRNWNPERGKADGSNVIYEKGFQGGDGLGRNVWFEVQVVNPNPTIGNWPNTGKMSLEYQVFD